MWMSRLADMTVSLRVRLAVFGRRRNTDSSLLLQHRVTVN